MRSCAARIVSSGPQVTTRVVMMSRARIYFNSPKSVLKDPYKIAFRDNADHVTSSFTHGHCANAMCIKELGNACQRIVRPARHDPLAGMLEKLTNLHGVPPYSFSDPPWRVLRD